jgi:hypothetical protein
MYPQLRGKSAYTQISLSLPLGVDVDDSETKTHVGITVWNKASYAAWDKSDPPEQLLIAGISFFRAGWVMRYGAGGPFVNQQRVEGFADLVNRRPKWSRSQLNLALKRAGARYGPFDKAAFRRSIPFQKLEKYLGKILAVTVSFDFPPEEGGGYQPGWFVSLSVERRGEEPSNYFLVFEPFDGRLVQIGNMKEEYPSGSSGSARTGSPTLAASQTTSRGANCIQSFLASMYPELLRQEVITELSSKQPFDDPWNQLGRVKFTVSDWHIAYWLHIRQPLDEREPEHGYFPRVQMKGEIHLDAKGQLDRFEASDSFALNSGRHADLKGLVQSHPDWKEEQGLQALKEAGTRFGPGEQEAFLKSIPMPVLEAFLGKIAIQSVKFDTMLPGDANLPMVTYFQWHVAIEAQRPGEARKKYVLHFEPFGGKLTEIKAPCEACEPALHWPVQKGANAFYPGTPILLFARPGGR